MSPLGDKALYLIEVKSTNSYVLNEMSDQDISHGLIVYSFNQYQGRGQRNNQWESEPNKNIALTVILENNLPKAGEQVILNPIFALAVRDYIESKNIPNVKIKWPNDILVGDEKIAGILIENSLQGNQLKESIVGIGVNINQDQYKDLPFATSLKLQKNKEYNLQDEVHEILKFCNKYWDFYLENGRDTVLKEYNKYLYKKQSKTKVYIKKDKQKIDVYPLALQRDGVLQCEDQFGHPYFFFHGEIEWLRE